jgi:hypothetical protein
MSLIETAKKTGRGVAVAAALVAVGSLTIAPTAAYADHWRHGKHWRGHHGHGGHWHRHRHHNGAAIALGLLGGALAGAAIASAANPYYYYPYSYSYYSPYYGYYYRY